MLGGKAAITEATDDTHRDIVAAVQWATHIEPKIGNCDYANTVIRFSQLYGITSAPPEVPGTHPETCAMYATISVRGRDLTSFTETGPVYKLDADKRALGIALPDTVQLVRTYAKIRVRLLLDLATWLKFDRGSS